jgi:hypothetical protein
MRPAVVVLGFVLGSAAAITFALGGTMIVFMALRSEYPRLDSELGRLLISVVLFALLTAAAAGSFYGELKGRPWRRNAHVLLFAMLVAVTAYYTWSRI